MTNDDHLTMLEHAVKLLIERVEWLEIYTKELQDKLNDVHSSAFMSIHHAGSIDTHGESNEERYQAY